MQEDQYQQFLRFLYNSRYFLGISLLLATINAIATFFNSLTAIQKFAISIYHWFLKKFYSKKRLIVDSLSLADDIKIFFKHRNLTKPYYDPTDIKNSIITGDIYSGETHKEFDINFRIRILFLRGKYLKYKIPIDLFNEFLVSPTQIDKQNKFIQLLSEVDVLLKASKDNT